MTATKTCNKCNTEKPLTDFYMDWRYKGGRKHQCKSCHYVKPEITPKRQDQALRSHLKTKYNISMEDFEELFHRQEGRCAICGSDGSNHKKYNRLVVDHNHTTGKVRGLLCFSCNVGLGSFQDNSDILEKANQYLCVSV